ncbi:MAG: helix-turn-helix transcriptional regulator [Eggerthella lenta]
MLLAEGRSSSYIAGELVLSDNTVRSYVKNIYQKLDVHSKQDVIDFVKAL